MKPNRILVQALRRAAKRIEEGDYNWYEMSRCNCGILVQELLGLSEDEFTMYRLEQKAHSNWSLVPRTHFCPTTGMPLSDITKLLAKYGFEQDDYQLLEMLGQPIEALPYPLYDKNRSPLVEESKRRYTDGSFVSKSFLEIADRLEAQLPDDPTNTAKV